MTPTTEPRSHKGLICFMALMFASFLFSSLWQRFTHPDLVISHMPEQSRPDMPMNEGMGLVGQLMQKVAQNPQDLESTLKLAESLMSLGEWQGAENFAQKAVSLASGNPEEIRPLLMLALIHHNNGKHEQAAELLEKSLEKRDDPIARYNLGILYAHYLKQADKGRDQFRQALSHEGIAPGLKAAIEDELKKIEAALPAEDAAARAYPLEDAPADLAPQNH